MAKTMDKRQRLINILIPSLLVLALTGVAPWEHAKSACDKYRHRSAIQEGICRAVRRNRRVRRGLSKIQVAGTRTIMLLLSNAWNRRQVQVFGADPASHLEHRC